LPLLTTKRIGWKTSLHETLWLLSGKCNTTDYLLQNNVHIWDGNTSREYLDSRGLNHYKEGELGPCYGVQWRNWNHTGIDQLKRVIDTLKQCPNDRRMVVSAWNPEQEHLMALPACHMNYQFVVTNSELNCVVTMRSCDVPIGLPFNIASYAFITHMVSRIVDIPPGELVINMADCHMYENQIDGVLEQITREPRRFPRLQIADKKYASVDDFEFGDFAVLDYTPHATIKMPMAV
jgi:thymidylate synthase